MKAWTYITTNRPNGVLYVGMTSELKYRIQSHKTKKYKKSFSARYNLDKLVWYEEHETITAARAREKQTLTEPRKQTHETTTGTRCHRKSCIDVIESEGKFIRTGIPGAVDNKCMKSLDKSLNLPPSIQLPDQPSNHPFDVTDRAELCLGV